MNEEQEQLVELLETAVSHVYQEERFLLSYSEGEREGLEQAFVFRTGIYLSGQLAGTPFEGLDLDSEYNKSYGDPKRTKHFPRGVRPDLILHRRNSNAENKLVVEFKGYWDTEIDRDAMKLIDLTHPEDSYQYAVGVLVIIGKTKPSFSFFVNGQQT